MTQQTLFECAKTAFEDQGIVRPDYLPEMTLKQIEAVEMMERVLDAAVEFERQLLLDEVDLSFVPQDVLRQLHLYVMDDPKTTVAAVVGRAVTILFKNVINCEMLPPDIARIILSGRAVDSLKGVA